MGWIALTDNQLSLFLSLGPQKHPVNDITKTRKAEASDQEQNLHVHQNVPAAGSGHTERAETYFSCKSVPYSPK